MTEELDAVDQTLEDLGLGGEATESGDVSTGNKSKPEEKSEPTTDRLERLHEAGAITDEEYEMLRDRVSEDDTGSSKPDEFGQPLVTSEGTDMDFSIVGVFEDVDTSKLIYDNKGDPSRTVVCWQIHNHSTDEILLKHKHIEYIGQNQISYRLDKNPLQVKHFGPGWRMKNWEEITSDTRIRYATPIEIPNRLSQIKIDGYCSDVHSIDITDDMFFPHSELPVKIDL